MVHFDLVPKLTNSIWGEHTIRISDTVWSKVGLTVMLHVHASGYKDALFVAFKEQGGEIPQRAHAQLRVLDNVKIITSLNGWMTNEKMAPWVRCVWGWNVNDVHDLLIVDSTTIQYMHCWLHRTGHVNALMLVHVECAVVILVGDLFQMDHVKREDQASQFRVGSFGLWW